MRPGLLLLYIFVLSVGVSSLPACQTRREPSRGDAFQNFTARYNTLYNSRILLEESWQWVKEHAYDDYSDILPMFAEPPEGEADLDALADSLASKASSLISSKGKSRYVADAYFFLAEAHYLKRNFFQAAEFYQYVYRAYPERSELSLAALSKKARANIQAGDFDQARASVDTALALMDHLEKPHAEVYATYAQLCIESGRYKEAMEMLDKAIAARGKEKDRVRWTYILAQVQQRASLPEEAAANFLRVAESNAGFEMALRARLNLAGTKYGSQEEQRVTDQLQGMLRSDKNREYSDLIYYELGNIYAQEGSIAEAKEMYAASLISDSNRPMQKGLAFWRLANLFFDEGDYLKAESYYDSSLAVLPSSFPAYHHIRKKAENLQLLAEPLRLIRKEQFLRMLAKLPEGERESAVQALTQQSLHDSNSSVSGVGAPEERPSQEVLGQPSAFYFNNLTALQQGYADFRRRWGNRALADHWRRGSRTGENALPLMTGNQYAEYQAPGLRPQTASDKLRLEYLRSIPDTPEKLQQSTERLASAYFELAGLYRSKLNDERAALRTYEEMLKQTAESSYQPAVYYHLQSLYQRIDPDRAGHYRKLLLSRYPGSAYARLAENPGQLLERDAARDALHEAYNTAYELYASGKDEEAMAKLDSIRAHFGRNSLSPQVAYLHALALGHTTRLPAFESALRKLVADFPEDKLVRPLALQHLGFIENNRADMEARSTALIRGIAEARIAQATGTATGTPTETSTQQRAEPPGEVSKPGESAGEASTPKGAFNLPQASDYYFVVNVMSSGINLNPSRFGIGQFNRLRYADVPIKHQLKVVNNENQLIFVGPFSNKDDVIRYEDSILPLMPEIMKVSPDKYNTFVITSEGLNKLNTRTIINSYLEFYKNNR